MSSPHIVWAYIARKNIQCESRLPRQLDGSAVPLNLPLRLRCLRSFSNNNVSAGKASIHMAKLALWRELKEG